MKKINKKNKLKLFKVVKKKNLKKMNLLKVEVTVKATFYPTKKEDLYKIVELQQRIYQNLVLQEKILNKMDIGIIEQKYLRQEIIKESCLRHNSNNF